MYSNVEESIETYRMRLDGVAISTYILIMVLVPLKLWCRKRSGGWGNLKWDDFFSVVALLLANGFFWICLIGMRKQLGLHANVVPPPQIIEFLRYVFIAQLFYVWAICVIKFSVLAFYWRLFSVNARYVIYFVTFLVVSWLIALNFLVIFACLPVQASWDITLVATAKCIPLRSIYLGGSVPNVITDVIMVVMPIPYVWKLHAPIGQRVILAGIFTLGTFIAVVSLVRLIIFLQIPIGTAGDVTYNFREIIVWSVVEINIGLTCACLPSLKPALSMLGLNRLFSFTNSRPSDNKSPGPSSNFPSYGYDSKNSSKSRPRKKGATGGLFSTLAGITKIDSEEDGFQMIDKQNEIHGKNHTEIEMSRLSDDSNPASQNTAAGDQRGISVTKNWNVYSSERKPTQGV